MIFFKPNYPIVSVTSYADYVRRSDFFSFIYNLVN